MDNFDVPVLFLMFNRPNHAKRVLEQIRIFRPTQFYVAIDGPRLDHPTDFIDVKNCRELLNSIDWPCQLWTLVRKENLGCRQAVSSAIDWFFDNVEMGIVLEDDCLPSFSFFTFCRENLIRYQHESVVMHIGGVNHQMDRQYGNGSYYFTKVCHIWGWATWKRAWMKYDVSMKNFSTFNSQHILSDLFSDRQVELYWKESFLKVYQQEIDTWDYQWVYAIWCHSGLCILPNKNLVTNIGFDSSATHTKNYDELVADKPYELLNDIVHPTFMLETKQATDYSMRLFFRKNTWLENKIERIKKRIQKRSWKI